jgi:CubicO group peptidase (beta-lactamase class C family)
MTTIHGFCPPRFAPVREAFAANFAEGRELGARFAVCVEGELAVDLWAGAADRSGARPFEAETLVPVFSTSKAVSAVVIAGAVSSGRLDYEQPVADLWPEFAQAGKAELTVAQVLSHQAGLPGVAEVMDPSEWYDWDAICARLAAMAPMWPPGSASGYHPVTWGYLAGEIFRRATGRTIGAALREDFTGPLGLDLWLGLPEVEHSRVAELQRPPAMPDLGQPSEARRAAFLTKWASPGGRSSSEWRRAEIPSVNLHATAPALARLMAVVACGGTLDGRRVLSPETVEALIAERISAPTSSCPSRCPGRRADPHQPAGLALRPGRAQRRPLRLGRLVRLRRPRRAGVGRLHDEPPVGGAGGRLPPAAADRGALRLALNLHRGEVRGQRGLAVTPPGGEGEHRHAGPDEGEGEAAQGAPALARQQADGELQGRRDELQEAHGRQVHAARRPGEQHQRDHRRWPGGQQQQGVGRPVGEVAAPLRSSHRRRAGRAGPGSGTRRTGRSGRRPSPAFG